MLRKSRGGGIALMAIGVAHQIQPVQLTPAAPDGDDQVDGQSDQRRDRGPKQEWTKPREVAQSAEDRALTWPEGRRRAQPGEEECWRSPVERDLVMAKGGFDPRDRLIEHV